VHFRVCGDLGAEPVNLSLLLIEKKHNWDNEDYLFCLDVQQEMDFSLPNQTF